MGAAVPWVKLICGSIPLVRILFYGSNLIHCSCVVKEVWSAITIYRQLVLTMNLNSNRCFTNLPIVPPPQRDPATCNGGPGPGGEHHPRWTGDRGHLLCHLVPKQQCELWYTLLDIPCLYVLLTPISHSSSQINLGHIPFQPGLIPTPPPPVTTAPMVLLGVLVNGAHRVSGNVFALADRTLMLTEFNYDGTAPGKSLDG